MLTGVDDFSLSCYWHQNVSTQYSNYLHLQESARIVNSWQQSVQCSTFSNHDHVAR